MQPIPAPSSRSGAPRDLRIFPAGGPASYQAGTRCCDGSNCRRQRGVRDRHAASRDLGRLECGHCLRSWEEREEMGSFRCMYGIHTGMRLQLEILYAVLHTRICFLQSLATIEQSRSKCSSETIQCCWYERVLLYFGMINLMSRQCREQKLLIEQHSSSGYHLKLR